MDLSRAVSYIVAEYRVGVRITNRAAALNIKRLPDNKPKCY